MKDGHTHLVQELAYFWEKQALKISAFDTLSIVDWCFIYLNDLKRFGINDVYLLNGFNNLCEAYSRKIHSQLIPFIINILQQDVDFENSVIESADLTV